VGTVSMSGAYSRHDTYDLGKTRGRIISFFVIAELSSAFILTDGGFEE
jgi:hypothetical protein